MPHNKPLPHSSQLFRRKNPAVLPSRVLAEGAPPSVPRSYRAPADHSRVRAPPSITGLNRLHGNQDGNCSPCNLCSYTYKSLGHPAEYQPFGRPTSVQVMLCRPSSHVQGWPERADDGCGHTALAQDRKHFNGTGHLLAQHEQLTRNRIRQHEYHEVERTRLSCRNQCEILVAIRPALA